MPARFLVIGGGGREHALVRRLALDPSRPLVFAAPGNPGTEFLAESVPLDVNDAPAVAAWAVEHGIDCVIVGPEDPLIAGLADVIRAAGVPVFGPGADGARLEGDKNHAKNVMAAAGVPTARHETFNALAPALVALDRWSTPPVVKACGAAQGKGVAVCTSRDEAEWFLRACFEDERFGAAGLQVLLEERLVGPELSVLAITDGEAYVLLAPSRDHKRVGEGDQGPNTGGMGAFASGCLVDSGLARTVCTDVIEPVLAELRRRGTPYRGVLYAGLMLTAEGPKVLEFNCRFGDPETQVVLPLIKDGFPELILATSQGELGTFLAGLSPAPAGAPTPWPGAALSSWDQAAVVVVGASEGYPGDYPKGRVITLPADDVNAWIVHAGTRSQDGAVVTAGGRVLGAVGMGQDFEAARTRAYGLLDGVAFEGMHFRRDIGAGFKEGTTA